MPNDTFLHMLRNKLTIVKGYLDLIRPESVEGEDRKFLIEAKTELKNLSSLLGEFEDDPPRVKPRAARGHSLLDE